MTRIPQLEAELVAAAARRRRRAWWPTVRVLVPATAALLLVLAVASVDDPEVEAPVVRGKSPVEVLRSGPDVDPRITPVSLTTGPWTVGAVANLNGLVCISASTGAESSVKSGCVDPREMADYLTRRPGAEFIVHGDADSRLVYGLARGDVQAMEVAVGGVKRRALVDRHRLTMDPPAGGRVSFRLFVATFTPREVPAVDKAKVKFFLTYEDGSEATSGIMS